MNNLVTVIERVAGYFIGLVAILTFSEAVMRYVFVMHIPDVFVIGQMLQGIAICWGIATAAYADRHITVDIVYTFGTDRMRRVFDLVGYTLNLIYMTGFSVAITYKVFDIAHAGEISDDLAIPLWTGYSFASAAMIPAEAKL